MKYLINAVKFRQIENGEDGPQGPQGAISSKLVANRNFDINSASPLTVGDLKTAIQTKLGFSENTVIVTDTISSIGTVLTDNSATVTTKEISYSVITSVVAPVGVQGPQGPQESKSTNTVKASKKSNGTQGPQGPQGATA